MTRKNITVLLWVLVNVSFLYGVAQTKMSVSYCREVVREDMIAAKEYQENLINDLVRAGR